MSAECTFKSKFKKSRGKFVERFRSIKSSKSFNSSQACEFTNILVHVVWAPAGSYAVVNTWGSYWRARFAEEMSQSDLAINVLHILCGTTKGIKLLRWNLMLQSHEQRAICIKYFKTHNFDGVRMCRNIQWSYNPVLY